MKSKSPSRTAVWQRLLAAQIPVVDRLLHRLAIRALARAALADDPSAVHALVTALLRPGGTVTAPILSALSQPLPAASRDQLWEEWCAGRLPALKDILIRAQVPASPQSKDWIISLACLGDVARLQNVTQGRVASLVELLHDPDPQIASTARVSLSKLSQQSSRDELYRLWADIRSPELWNLAREAGFEAKSPAAVRILYLLKTPEPEEILHLPAESILPVIAALQDPDPAITSQARRLLPLLQEKPAIDELCRIWQAERSSILGQVIREGCLVAYRPPELRLLSALQAGRGDLVRQASSTDLRYLLKFISDSDGEISSSARAALADLARPASRSALCSLAVEQDDPVAYTVALEAGYRPEAPDQRALFLFMSGRWDEYDTLDFDRRYLRAIYETAQPGLRQRIARQVQRSGQSAHLAILDGLDYRSNAARLTAEDVKVLVDLLVSNQEWPRLWSLVQILAFPWSARILQTLAGTAWQPEDEPEQGEFASLCQLARDNPIPTLEKFSSTLPPSVSTAVVHVSGRVNDVRFAPGQPLIAIGTGQRKLVLWNFQKACIEKVRQGFNHSISQVAFLENGCLVCGVRSNSSAACMIYGWQGEEAFVLPGHQGAVTALCGVGASRLLSAGRDGAVILWDVTTRSQMASHTSADWARTAIVSNDGTRAALLGSGLTLLRLPDLADCTPPSIRNAPYSAAQKSMPLSAAFVPDGLDFVSGQRNRQVILYHTGKGGRGITRKFLFSSRSPVVGLEFLVSRQLLIAAGRDGRLELRRWPDLTPTASLATGAEQLTSLHISPDGSFMAVGTGESAMQLWDLRILDLPKLFDLPLANARHEHLGAVMSLLQSPDLSSTLRRQMELLAALLRRRFRFDIQLEEMPQIQAGEFDILLD